jgi:hypothetical protein
MDAHPPIEDHRLIGDLALISAAVNLDHQLDRGASPVGAASAREGRS